MAMTKNVSATSKERKHIALANNVSHVISKRVLTPLKCPPQSRRVGSRLDEMCSTKRRKKIVQRHRISEIFNGKSEGRLQFFFVKKVIGSDTRVKNIPRCDSRRIVIRVVGTRSWNHQSSCTVSARRARCNLMYQGSALVATIEANCGLLIGIERQSVCKIRYRTGHFATVETPDELCPNPVFAVLVAQITSLLIRLVMIDAENTSVQW